MRMDPGISVEVGHGPEPVAMANRRRGVGNRRRGGAADRLDAGVPETVHRSPLLTDAIVQLTQSGQRGPGVRGHTVRNRDNAAVSSRVHELAARRGRNAVQDDRPPEVEAGADASHPSRPWSPVVRRAALHVPGENAARRQLIAIPRLGQERLAPQSFGGVLDRLFERQVLEGVQRVVVDEDADGPCAGNRCARSSMTRVRMVGRAGIG